MSHNVDVALSKAVATLCLAYLSQIDTTTLMFTSAL